MDTTLFEEDEMASAMAAMKKSKHYLNESDEIMNGFSDELLEEKMSGGARGNPDTSRFRSKICF